MKYFSLAFMLFVFVLAGCGTTGSTKAKNTPTAIAPSGGQDATAPQDKGAIVRAITDIVNSTKAHPDPNEVQPLREILLPVKLTGDILYQDNQAFVGVESTSLPVYFDLIYTSPSEATVGAGIFGKASVPPGWGVMSFGIGWNKHDCDAKPPLIKQRMYNLNLCD